MAPDPDEEVVDMSLNDAALAAMAEERKAADEAAKGKATTTPVVY